MLLFEFFQTIQLFFVNSIVSILVLITQFFIKIARRNGSRNFYTLRLHSQYTPQNNPWYSSFSRFCDQLRYLLRVTALKSHIPISSVIENPLLVLNILSLYYMGTHKTSQAFPQDFFLNCLILPCFYDKIEI